MEEGLMGKSYGHVLGSRPSKDPMEQITANKMIIESDTEIRWIDRNLGRPWGLGVFLGVIILFLILYSSWSGFLVTSIIVLGALLLPFISRLIEGDLNTWEIVHEPDLLFKTTGRWPTAPIYQSLLSLII
jgi:hypothetical protein